MHSAVQKVINLAKAAGYNFEFCKGETYGILHRDYDAPVVIDKGGRYLPVMLKGKLVPDPKASLLTPDFGKIKPLFKVKKGEVFRHKPNGPVWVRGEYDRYAKMYVVSKFDDTCRTALMAGATEVLVGFIF